MDAQILDFIHKNVFFVCFLLTAGFLCLDNLAEILKYIKPKPAPEITIKEEIKHLPVPTKVIYQTKEQSVYLEMHKVEAQNTRLIDKVRQQEYIIKQLKHKIEFYESE